MAGTAGVSPAGARTQPALGAALRSRVPSPRERQVLNMRNIIILGTGRSGTSMVAGTLSRASYQMGNDYIPARDSNPKGFFEDSRIVRINERLLAQHLPRVIPVLGRWLTPDRLQFGQRWLADLPQELEFSVSRRTRARIAGFVSKAPYAYKDPRFCYTLPVWRPFLDDTLFVCVFREPPATATSMITECSRARYLRNVRMTRDRALDIWNAMYTHVLRHSRHGGDWLFLHFDDVVSGDGLGRLESASGAQVDETFPDRRLRHSEPHGPIPAKTAEIYGRLCALSGHPDVHS